MKITPNLISWFLRVAVFGEFAGHGLLALLGEKSWVELVQKLTGADAGLAAQILFVVGLVDVSVAVITLVRPVNFILVWAVAWGVFTALLPFLMGESIFEFMGEWTNWGAPLALLLMNLSRFSKK